MTKKEISSYLLNELKTRGLDINQGFVNAIIEDVYKNDYNYKFFFIYYENNNYDYNAYMCSNWELKTQDRYYSYKKHLLHTKNEIIELKFEKRSFKRLVLYSK